MVGAELLNPGVPEFDGALDEFIIDVQDISNLLKQFFFTFVEITVDRGDIDQAFQNVFGVLLGKPDWSDLRLSLIHISEPTRLRRSRMPSSA